MASSSAEIVANIEELLRQILISTPALSLIRFKCVSKHWLSLISDPDFRCCHNLQNPNPSISAFFSPRTKQGTINSVGISAGNPFKGLTSSATRLRILQSCNGLFLCSVEASEEETNSHPRVYVVNPTTNEFRAISAPSLMNKEQICDMFVRYGLVFDPSESPHYTVVCVSHDKNFDECHQIEIYSSETGTWGRSFEIPFNEDEEGWHLDDGSREGAVYCNGAIHWIRDKRREDHFPFFEVEIAKMARYQNSVVLHYYDIGDESLWFTATTPPVPLVVKNFRLKKKHQLPKLIHNFQLREKKHNYPELIHRYFGKSSYGCLYMIEIFKQCKTQFDVMEMESDYSGWFVKSHVETQREKARQSVQAASTQGRRVGHGRGQDPTIRFRQGRHP
ncbi:F-box protein At5g07610-like [Argentina anserina]|uniref:F-box protein At5g07610-like n=1 Tax=Argentina anserina TaxID=57926 RepID=UPI002176684B|nr:F-box protein At5g07610-like [Potentilla anserina]